MASDLEARSAHVSGCAAAVTLIVIIIVIVIVTVVVIVMIIVVIIDLLYVFYVIVGAIDIVIDVCSFSQISVDIDAIVRVGIHIFV